MQGARSVILGIDAAWKWSNGSGVAVVSGADGCWRLEHVAPSYSDFFMASAMESPESAVGLPKELIQAASKFGQGTVQVVAIDMPLSRRAIVGRRCADNIVNEHYAARWASTHSMVDVAATTMSAELTTAFEKLGLPLITEVPKVPALIEVYPHIALIELLRAPRRLEYKVGKRRDYWPDHSVHERKVKLLNVWANIMSALKTKLSDLDRHLELPTCSETVKVFKSFEDKLDSVICAYVGIEYFEGRARPYGDQDAAIWGPAEQVQR